MRFGLAGGAVPGDAEPARSTEGATAAAILGDGGRCTAGRGAGDGERSERGWRWEGSKSGERDGCELEADDLLDDAGRAAGGSIELGSSDSESSSAESVRIKTLVAAAGVAEDDATGSARSTSFPFSSTGAGGRGGSTSLDRLDEAVELGRVDGVIAIFEFFPTACTESVPDETLRE